MIGERAYDELHAIGNYTDTDPTRPKKYTNNPVKLVFHVPNLQTMSDRITAKGLPVTTPAAAPEFGGAMVERATDVDGYTLELVEDTTITVPFLAAGGIGVSDAGHVDRVLHKRLRHAGESCQDLGPEPLG